MVATGGGYKDSLKATHSNPVKYSIQQSSILKMRLAEWSMQMTSIHRTFMLIWISDPSADYEKKDSVKSQSGSSV